MTGFGEENAGRPSVYRFGEFTVDPAGFRLSRGDKTLRVEPKALELLIYLIEHRDRVVGKDELLDAVWKGTFVTQNALTRAIAHLRKALGDDADAPRYIETIPTRGYRFIGDETLSAPPPGPATVPVSLPVRTTLPPIAPPSPGRRPMVACLVLVAVAAVAVVLMRIDVIARRAVGTVRRISQNTRPAQPVQFAARPLVSEPGLHLFPAVSPDGYRIAYSSLVGNRLQIFVSTPSAAAVQLTRDVGGAIQPSWSPDGQWLAYASADAGGIWIVPANGGSVRQVTKSGFRPAWSPDGELVFQSGKQPEVGGLAVDALPPSTLWVVNIASGRVEALTRAGNPAGGHGAPSWRADGKRIAFSSCDIEHCAIYTVARDGSSLTQIRRDSITLSSPVFSSDGGAVHYLVSRYNGSGLVEQRVTSEGAPVGSSTVLRGSGPRNMHHLGSAAGARRLAWSLVEQTSQLVSIAVTRNGVAKAEKAVTDRRIGGAKASFPSFSADGSKIAWCAIGAGDATGVWVAEPDGSNPKPLSVSNQLKQHTQWGRTSWEVFYYAWENVPALVALSLIDGRAMPVAILPPGASSPRISPDRSMIAFNRSISGEVSVWSMKVDGTGLQRLSKPGDLARSPIWSPSGKQLAIQLRRADGTVAVGVMASSGGVVRVITTEPEAAPYSWSPDERLIAYSASRGAVSNIWAVEVATGKSRRVTTNDSPERWLRHPAWSPDGKRIVYESGVTTSEVWISNPF